MKWTVTIVFLRRMLCVIHPRFLFCFVENMETPKTCSYFMCFIRQFTNEKSIHL